MEVFFTNLLKISRHLFLRNKFDSVEKNLTGAMG